MSQCISDMGVFDIKMAQAGESLMVVFFYAMWSVPCNVIAPIYERLANHYKDGIFLRVDIDEAEVLAKRFEVSIVPSFVFIQGNKIRVLQGGIPGLLQKMIRDCAAQF
ncbi:thioredoxin-1 [Halyomorpha halys]|uniref:thioredoxin-1 n=1 Tax=Halyomorpha halys TaxID=286706 RepID=UPI0006D4F604|nr:thioredoxin-1-like [Halyomorpha halys]